MKKADVVLVGFGGYAEVYVEYILANKNPLINLAGVVKPYPERSRFCEELKSGGIQWGRACFCTFLKRMLRSDMN